MVFVEADQGKGGSSLGSRTTKLSLSPSSPFQPLFTHHLPTSTIPNFPSLSYARPLSPPHASYCFSPSSRRRRCKIHAGYIRRSTSFQLSELPIRLLSLSSAFSPLRLRFSLLFFSLFASVSFLSCLSLEAPLCSFLPSVEFLPSSSLYFLFRFATFPLRKPLVSCLFSPPPPSKPPPRFIPLPLCSLRLCLEF